LSNEKNKQIEKYVGSFQPYLVHFWLCRQHRILLQQYKLPFYVLKWGEMTQIRTTGHIKQDAR